MAETTGGVEHDVMAFDALAPGAMAGLRAGPWHVLLVNDGEALHALNNRCSHAAARLNGGLLRGGTVMCPRHGARFALATGACNNLAYPAIRTFPLRVVNSRILVTVPAAPPDLSEVPIP